MKNWVIGIIGTLTFIISGLISLMMLGIYAVYSAKKYMEENDERWNGL